ncbi:MAG: hypothetical protein GY799_28310 [Desulfobulbaceae bacterium]|nr:hypothetical protein [Desulfobulbaceae bacterium]
MTDPTALNYQLTSPLNDDRNPIDVSPTGAGQATSMGVPSLGQKWELAANQDLFEAFH